MLLQHFPNYYSYDQIQWASRDLFPTSHWARSMVAMSLLESGHLSLQKHCNQKLHPEQSMLWVLAYVANDLRML